MNTGDEWGEFRLARFNGGLFADSHVPDLFKDEIELLHQAARFDWGEVDPSIFGTLLESALSPEERHKLGAHYTPRSFIERLIRPTIEEPLRGDWDLVQAEALTILGPEPTEANRAKAREILHAFHRKLASTRILDPACGSGNFLYVAYDTLKRLEQEVLSRLDDFGETRRALALDEVMVTPAQFLGIEVKPWAAAIAELVLWIGHLQWWIRLHPGYTPPEPILQRYENIQCRDAVLTWSETKATGQSRWDGKTFKKHPVTGKDVPDETAQIAIVEHLKPCQAEWPKADFIVGNPPFLGNKRMRDALGDGYSEALRKAYPDVPDSVDFVLYWWHKAADQVQCEKARRFGFITTNSLRQVQQRAVIAFHFSQKNPIRIVWAIPDHPWTEEGADVRIAMTVGALDGQPWLGQVIEEPREATPEGLAESLRIEGRSVECINEDLSAGANVALALPLMSNRGLSSQGLKLIGSGFIVSQAQWEIWGRPSVVHPYRNGRDFTETPRGVMVIDLFGFSEEEVREQYPAIYQHVFERVKPERDHNTDPNVKARWWTFGRNRDELRLAMKGLKRFIATVETSKHRVFQFFDTSITPDNKLIVIPSEDAFHLGVLSSNIHVVWSVAAGSRMGIGNDPVYPKTRCFDPFPFPEPSVSIAARIRSTMERLDVHRKNAQKRGATITQMYNILEKLRLGVPFTDKERVLHDKAQTEVLRQLHDDLDTAVATAYGWPTDLAATEILEHLVDLNRERATEEARGLVRWLRPEYQAPGSVQPLAKPIFQPEEVEAVAVASTGIQPWPKEVKEQLAALRALLLGSPRLWTLEEIGRAFKSRGRYREGIASHLELLTDLGVICQVATTEGSKFHRPQAMGA